MITGIAHINLLVPEGSLAHAESFYGDTLALTSAPVPHLQKGSILWYSSPPVRDRQKRLIKRFNLGSSGQQIHIAPGVNESMTSKRHPCFRIESQEKLLELQQRIWEHRVRGDEAAPLEADRPGENSGTRGVEYPSRFFARDYAGNRLEFSL